MNMFELGERLKDFSKDQLVNEMRRPSGSVPQFLVLSELQRRRRMESAAMADQPQQTTVADDAVAAAGVPQAGLMQMARALAPKTDMDQNTGVTEMSGGGVVRMQAGGLSGVSRDLGVYSPTLGTTSPMHSETGMLYSEMTDAELGPMAALGDADAAMELRVRGIGVMDDGEVTEVNPEMERIQQENIDFLTGMGQGVRRTIFDPLIRAGQRVGDTAGAVAEGINTGLTNLAAIVGDEQAYEDLSSMGEYISEQRSGPRWESPEGEVTLGDTLDYILGGELPGRSTGDMLSPDDDLLPPPSMTMGDPSTLLGEEDLLPPTPVDVSDEAETGAGGAGGAGGVGGGIGSDSLYEQDKWLALAQFGLGLMSSREPTLGGAIGEAGQAGIAALRDARESMVERQEADRLMRLREAVAAREDEPSDTLSPTYINAVRQYATELRGRLDSMLPEGFTPSDLVGAEREEYLTTLADYNTVMRTLGRGIFG